MTVTEADNGRTVQLEVGQRLFVRLSPTSGSQWTDPTAYGPLYRQGLRADATATTAGFDARSAGSSDVTSA